MRIPIRALCFCLLSGILLTFPGCTEQSDPSPNAVLDPTPNPFIGTGGHGHTYPGASMPFGMVQLSPDTRLEGWDGCSGYHYTDSLIYGFSHTHLSGTGIPDYGDILLMPVVSDGIVWLNNGADGNPGYRSPFQKSSEKARPGYYEVHLDNGDINVALTATKRAGFHQYQFPDGKQSYVIIDLVHRDKVIDSKMQVISDTEVAGYRISTAWAKEQYVYFVARFSQPFKSHMITSGTDVLVGEKEAQGTELKSWYQFETKAAQPLLVKVGISAVSMEGARKNLDQEIPHWDFQKTLADAEQAWDESLSKIKVEGGTQAQQTIFYSALYHTMLNPNLFMDVDGQYRSTDLKVHESHDHTHYTVFSLWDTYRATHPLFTLIEQERTKDFLKTFEHHYMEGGQLPIWELAGNYTGCMIGYHSIPVIVDAYEKGIKGYNEELLYEAMKASAMQDHLGLAAYKKLGFIPSSSESESVSKTLEYAYDDWCIAQMAKSMKKEEDYAYFLMRAQAYKNLFDPSTGFMRAKMHNRWFSPFDPAEVNFNYTEANSWQYSFYVPQDISGFASLLGGKRQLSQKLDDLFAADEQTTGREQADITGLIGQYAHGNEPSHHMAYLYDYVDEAYKTQERVRQIMDELYSDQPDGLSGNEDCGQMSAWYVMSAMGFYPVTPGLAEYAIGTPLFPKVTISLENGKQFVIEAPEVSKENKYIQSATLNGENFNQTYLNHSTIMEGGTLHFKMHSVPNKAWGGRSADIPITSIHEHLITPVPWFEANSRTFTDSMVVAIGHVDPTAKVFYHLGDALQVKKYRKPVTIHETTTFYAYAEQEDQAKSVVVESEFFKIKGGRSIVIKNPYANQYAAGGDHALIDYLRGPEDFKTGYWQGYRDDMEVVIDLGRAQNISLIATGFLQDIKSWIWMPKEVEYAVSMDGKEYAVVATVKPGVPDNQEGAMKKDLMGRFRPREARYVRVVAKQYGVCPDWHLGAGGKTWIFADEVVVE